jgi:hypothetical protein
METARRRGCRLRVVQLLGHRPGRLHRSRRGHVRKHRARDGRKRPGLIFSSSLGIFLYAHVTLTDPLLIFSTALAITAAVASARHGVLESGSGKFAAGCEVLCPLLFYTALALGAFTKGLVVLLLPATVVGVFPHLQSVNPASTGNGAAWSSARVIPKRGMLSWIPRRWRDFGEASKIICDDPPSAGSQRRSFIAAGDRPTLGPLRRALALHQPGLTDSRLIREQASVIMLSSSTRRFGPTLDVFKHPQVDAVNKKVGPYLPVTRRPHVMAIPGCALQTGPISRQRDKQKLTSLGN